MVIRSLLRLVCFAVATLSLPVAANSVNVYNWSEYLPNHLIQQFTKETGIRVNYTTYDSNEAVFAKLKLSDGGGYDLIFPSAYYVQKFAQAKLIQPLDKTRLSNIANLDPALLYKPYDPDNQYSLPYLWGSTGLAVNTESYPTSSLSSWKDLWHENWQGLLQLPNDVREVFHLALVTLGYSGNTEDPEQIKEAYELLTKLMPNVQAFNSDAQRLAFVTGDVEAGVIWNAEVWMAQEDNPAIQYVYPEEGAIFWVDCMSIPTGAKNVDAAYAFIDFLLRPDVAKVLVEEIGYATPNQAGKALLEKSVRDDPMIFPSTEIIEKGEFQNAVSEQTTAIYEQYWQKLKLSAR